MSGTITPRVANPPLRSDRALESMRSVDLTARPIVVLKAEEFALTPTF